MKPSTPIAGGRFRAAWLPDPIEYAPVRWLVLSALVLMAAIAVGTAFTISRFRESAIESGKQELESAVLLLARHFDQQLEDFSVLQKEIVRELQASQISQPDIFKSEMGTLAIHEMLRDKASGWPDVAGVNLFDEKGVLINSSQRWPVADLQISDRAYFRNLIDDVSLSQTVDVVPSRFTAGYSIVFARRILGPNGEFLGAVTRAVKPATLESFLASVELGAEATIAMHQKEGALLARYPHVGIAMIGENFNTVLRNNGRFLKRGNLPVSFAAPWMERSVSSRRTCSAPFHWSLSRPRLSIQRWLPGDHKPGSSSAWRPCPCW